MNTSTATTSTAIKRAATERAATERAATERTVTTSTVAEHTVTRVGNTTATPSFWAHLKDELRIRRDARARRIELEHELASFTTPSEIDDLLAMVDRQEGPDAPVIRSILSENLRAYHARTALAG